MSNQPRILAFSGSAKKNSLNQRLVAIAAQGATEVGAEVTLVNLAEYPMPLFNEDLEKEEGPSENVLSVKKLLEQNDGLLLACPEYNSSITPLLKNTIDWTSRPDPERQGLVCWRGKTAGIMSASPGALGGLRGLVHVRSILSNIGVLVVPEQRAIGSAFDAFAEDGSLKDEKQSEAVKAIGKRVAELIAGLKSG